MTNHAPSEEGVSAQPHEPPPLWSLLPSPAGLGLSLVFQQQSGVAVFAPPGVPLAEEWDSDDLNEWRVARWPDLNSFRAGVTAGAQRRLSGLPEALEQVPVDALDDRSVHAWMITATEAHADALERLSILQEHEAGDGVTDAVSELRRLVRRHREEAARSLTQPAFLLGADRSSHGVAQILVDEPQSVPALIDRDLNRDADLSTFAAALQRIEREYGQERVRDALTGLLFAKHHSHSWRVTAHMREARRSARRAARRLRRVAAERLERDRAEEQHAESPEPETSAVPMRERLRDALIQR